MVMFQEYPVYTTVLYAEPTRGYKLDAPFYFNRSRFIPFNLVMATTVLDNGWKQMFLDRMSVEEAGRLFKAIMDIRCGVTDVVPEEFKFVLPVMQKFWGDLDLEDEMMRERQRQRALKRWHGSTNPVESDSTSVPPKEPVRIKKAPSVIDYSPSFLQFWDAYPKKKKKAMAYLRWNEALKGGADADYIIRKAMDYATECRLKHVEDRYIMYPEGWLNQTRYDDEFFTGTKQVDMDSISDGLDELF